MSLPDNGLGKIGCAVIAQRHIMGTMTDRAGPPINDLTASDYSLVVETVPCLRCPRCHGRLEPVPAISCLCSPLGHPPPYQSATVVHRLRWEVAS